MTPYAGARSGIRMFKPGYGGGSGHRACLSEEGYAVDNSRLPGQRERTRTIFRSPSRRDSEAESHRARGLWIRVGGWEQTNARRREYSPTERN